jgi:deazaflavin-dependent oxidoreductase (nitroreductase family)
VNIVLDRIRYFDKYTLNRVMLKVAGRNRLPFAVIYHVGRRSGRPYRTPILVEPLGRGFVVTLTYGPETDWYRNALAAGEYSILWHRKKYRMRGVEIVDSETALPAFPAPARLALRALGIRQFVRCLLP